MADYKVFEALLKKNEIEFTKEMMLKKLFGSNSTSFNHRFRIDYVITVNHYPELCIEIEGGTFTGGRHNKGLGFWNDTLKYNAITAAGYPLLRFTAIMVKTNPVDVVQFILDYINSDLTVIKISSFVEKHKKRAKKKR